MKHERLLAEWDRELVLLRWYDDDPCSWMVKRYRKGLIRKRCISSAWFSDSAQAEAYARRLKKDAAG